MIHKQLVPALKKRYAGRDVRYGSLPDPIAVFPAAHPSVGDLTIWDDGEEVRVSIGEITHGHFDGYSAPSPDKAEDWIVENVLSFLEEMFADRYLLWKLRQGGSGGWARVDYAGESFRPKSGVDTFVRSGPYALK
jgi:hypothetical protein